MDIEYFDLMQLSKAISRKIGKLVAFNFKLYDDTNSQYEIKPDGDEFEYFTDTRLSIYGSEWKVSDNKCDLEGIWDVRLVFTGIGIKNYITDSRMNSLEDLCERYGYCVSLIDTENNQLFLEIMDRIVIDGKVYESIFTYCDEKGIDYFKLCEIALRNECSTIDAVKVYKDHAVSTEQKLNTKNLQSVERVVAFNGRFERK